MDRRALIEESALLHVVPERLDPLKDCLKNADRLHRVDRDIVSPVSATPQYGRAADCSRSM